MSSAGQIIGGVAGAVVGFFAGGNVALGASIGMAIGGAIDPPKGPKIEGPRLDDLSFQSSSLGTPLGRAYGGPIPVTGNIIWLEGDKYAEITTTETQGGKGGGGGGQEVKTHAYYATFAVSLLQIPDANSIASLARLWIGSNLVYDAQSDNLDSVIASQFEQGVNFTFYSGADDQLPNPRWQADKGINNVSARPGKCYIVIEDLNLTEKYSNSLQVAQVKAEIIISAVPEIQNETLASIPTDDVSGISYPMFEATTSASGSDYVVLERLNFNLAPQAIRFGRIEYPYSNEFTLVQVAALNWGYTYRGYKTVQADERLFLTAQTQYTGYYFPWFRLFSPAGLVASSERYIEQDNLVWAALGYVIFDKGEIIMTAQADTTGKVQKISVDNGLLGASATYPYIGWVGASENYVFVVTETNVNYSPKVLRLNRLDLTLDATYSLTLDVIAVGAIQVVDDNTFYIAGSGGGGWNTTIYKVVNGSIVRYWKNIFPAAYHECSFKVFEDDPLYAVAMDQAATTYDYKLAHTVTPSQPAKLHDIITAECSMAGISSGDLDLSGLVNDDVRGYRIGNRASVRSALEPLQTAYLFDVANSGYKIRFVSRGGASVATIKTEDLGASDSKDVALLPIAREMDSQIPNRVSVRYLDPSREFDTGEQSAFRDNVPSDNEWVVDLPLVLTAPEAAQIADMLDSKNWTERRDFGPFYLPQTWRHLEASDVITVEHRGQSHELRLTRVEYLTDGRLQCSAKSTTAASYTSTALGEVSLTVGQSTVPLAGVTTAYILDIPRIRDEQDGYGVTCGMMGASSGWPGATLLRSDDSGATFNALASTNSRLRVFSATDSLGAASSYSIDSTATLTVAPVTPAAELFSVTEDQLYAHSNLAAYGADGRWEILSFKMVVDNTGSFTLRDFLRGLYGSEGNSSLHVAGDLLVMLDVGVLWSGLPSSAIGVSKLYRAVTQGQSISSAANAYQTYQAVNLKPLSPVDVKADRNAITFEWLISLSRRSRQYTEVFSGSAVPLGESSEAYEIEIWSAGFSALKRTIASSNGAGISYTSAEQLADFGGDQATIYVKAYQISPSVGRGYALEQSIYRPLPLDPFIEYVTLLLHMNDTGLTDMKGNTVTLNGGAARVSAPSMFDGYALSTDGSGDYLTIPYSTAKFNWWDAPFCVEGFINPNSLTTASYSDAVQKPVFIGNANPSGVENYWSFGPRSDGTVAFCYYNGSSQIIASTATIGTGSRKHIAFCSDSSGLRIYIGGTLVASGSVIGTPQSSAGYPLTIGQINSTCINALSDEIRITRGGGGSARYTSNFAEPTTAFPDL